MTATEFFMPDPPFNDADDPFSIENDRLDRMLAEHDRTHEPQPDDLIDTPFP